MFTEDELLPLSGLQHLAFCERQWALIHIEQVWAENRLTADGRVLHERVHEQTEETRHDLLVVRGLPIHSFFLGLSGKADVVEFRRVSKEQSTPDSTPLDDRPGWWKPEPVEYKRGRAKWGSCDRVQLCAQAVCLEEMLGLSIAEGALFYGTNRRRTVVRFSPELRQQTGALAARMHELYKRRITPQAVLIPGCKSCSLRDLCLPKLPGRGQSVAAHYRTCLADD